MAHSLLLIPVPEAESVVRPRLARLSPQSIPPSSDVALAHITLIGPFADLDAIDDGLVSELGAFVADVVPFTFSLTGICEFPGGTTYLAPDPPTPFRQLTHELFLRFREFPPFDGMFEDVVPHLSVPVADDEAVESLRHPGGRGRDRAD